MSKDTKYMRERLIAEGRAFHRRKVQGTTGEHASFARGIEGEWWRRVWSY